MTLLASGKLDWGHIRLLGPETEPKVPQRILIFHTMVGNLHVVDRMFRVGGFDGTESHFGIGGKWSPEDTDGELFQWQVVGRQADAQFAGNDYATSIETADGGNPNNPWTSKQLNTLIRVAVDWTKGTHNPARLVTSSGGSGYGYHSQFHEWNTDYHTCPGQVRIGQLRTIVIPKAQAEISGTQHHVQVDPTKDTVAVDGIWGHGTVVATQLALGLRGADVDGIFGPQTRKALQKRVGAAPDGDIGPLTIKHWKSYLKGKGFYNYPASSITGAWGHGLTASHQKCLNAHKF